jgi:hypothetical protein
MRNNLAAPVFGGIVFFVTLDPATADEPPKPSFVDYLRSSTVPRNVIDGFLRGPSCAQFDPELGYVLGNFLPTDGINGSLYFLRFSRAMASIRFCNSDNPLPMDHLNRPLDGHQTVTTPRS